MTESKDHNTVAAILEAKSLPSAAHTYKVGIWVGKLYTDHGLPIDMALDKLDISKEQKINVLDGALWWLVEHRRNSHATDKALDRQRKANKETIKRFIETGEAGIY